jgi:hypothetical protein
MSHRPETNAPAAIVVIATKGRPNQVAAGIKNLKLQTKPPVLIVIVGTCEEDLPVINDIIDSLPIIKVVTPRIGVSSQRNVGIEYLKNAKFF